MASLQEALFLADVSRLSPLCPTFSGVATQRLHVLFAVSRDSANCAMGNHSAGSFDCACSTAHKSRGNAQMIVYSQWNGFQPHKVAATARRGELR